MVSIDVPSLLLKWNVILFLAWALHFLVGRSNPLLTVRLWRVTVLGLFAIALASILPPWWSMHGSVTLFLNSKDHVAVETRRDPRERTPAILIDPQVREPIVSPSMDVNPPHASESIITMSAMDREVPFKSEAQIFEHSVQGWVPEFQVSPVGEDTIVLVESAPTQNRARSILTPCLVLWGIGFCLSAASLGWQVLRSWSCLRGSRKVLIQDLLVERSVHERLLFKNTSVRTSSLVTAPCVMGIGWPSIVIPEDMLDPANDSSEALTLALTHELVHLEHHDLVWNFVMRCVQAVLWPLPTVWGMANAHLFACERVCDELSAMQIGDRTRYRTALAKIALQVLHRPAPKLAIPMAKRPDIFRRLELLSQRAPRLSLGNSSMVVSAALIAFSCVLGLSAWSKDSEVSTAPNASQNNTFHAQSELDQPESDQAEWPVDNDPKESNDALLSSSIEETPSVAPASKETPKVESPKVEPRRMEDSSSATLQPPANLRPIPIRKKSASANPADPIEKPVRHVGIMRGHVQDVQGQPIAQAKIVYSRYTLEQGSVLRELHLQTDQNGDWSLDLATIPTVLALKVMKEGFLESIIPSLETQVIHQTVLKPAYEFHGKVLESDGSPAQGVTVFAGTPPEYLVNSLQSPTNVARDKTDAQGRWRMVNILSPEITLYATRRPGELAIGVSRQAGQENQLQLRAPKTVRIQVTDSQGKPIPGANIRTRGWFGTLCPTKAVNTDANGVAEFDRVPQFEMFWTAEKTGFRTKWIKLHEKELERRVTLHPPHILTARVVDDATGAPIAQFTTQCDYDRERWIQAESEFWPDENGNATRNESGECKVNGRNGQLRVVSNLDFHFLRMRIQANGYDSLTCAPISHKNSQNQYTFRLKKASKVQIFDVDGQPAAHCIVAYHRSELSSSVNPVPGAMPKYGTRADADGRVDIAEIDPEHRDMIVAWTDKGCGIATRHDLVREDRLDLLPWSKLSLSLPRDFDVSTVQSRYHTRRPNSSTCKFQNEFTSKAENQFVNDRIPSGTICWTSLPTNFGKYNQIIRFQCEIKPNEERNIAPFGLTRLVGKVEFFDSKDATEIDSAQVWLRSVTPHQGVYWEYACECQPEGNFELERVHPGNYVARMQVLRNGKPLDSDTSLSLRFPVVVKDPTEENVLDLGTLPLSLSNTSSSTDFPIESCAVTDEYQPKGKIKFITADVHYESSQFYFWNEAGLELRKVIKQDVRHYMGSNDVVLSPQQSEFHLSSSNDIRTYDQNGREVQRLTWQGNRSVGIVGHPARGVRLFTQGLIENGKTWLRDLNSDKQSQNRVEVAQRFCQYSHHDQAYWSFLSSWTEQPIQCVRNDGTRVPLSFIPPSIRPFLLCVDEKEGGCWCLGQRQEVNNEVYLLRFSQEGQLVFQSEVDVDLFVTMAVVDGKNYLQILDRITEWNGLGNVTSSLPLKAKAMAGSADQRTLWVLTEDGVAEVDVSGKEMVVRGTIPGVTGTKLWVVD